MSLLLTLMLAGQSAAGQTAAVQTAAALPPICTDRPTKANATCTVPAGTVQLEAGVAGWSLTQAAGTRTEVLTLGASLAKIGLSDRSDLQIGSTPYARVTTDGRNRVDGIGDVVIRYKHRLTATDATVQIGVIPFVKLPTAADGIGNGKVEGGLAVPISLAVGKATLTLGPELDLLADADGKGHHAALVNIVNVALPVANRLTLVGELWSNLNFDPAGTVKQASADAALAYAVTNDVQLDVGANLGLTRDTADVELYGGLSVRF